MLNAASTESFTGGFTSVATTYEVNATTLQQPDVNDDVTRNNGIPKILFFVAFAFTAAVVSILVTMLVRWCMVKFQLGGMKKSKPAPPFESSNLNLPVPKRASQSSSELFQIRTIIPLGEKCEWPRKKSEEEKSLESCGSCFTIHGKSQEQVSKDQKIYGNYNKI